MKIPATILSGLALGAVFEANLICPTASAQGLLDEIGTSILAPVMVPTGGYAGSPQEYLSVAWSVTENASQVYTYSYTVQNPSGDVLLNTDGSLTTTPETFDYFSVGFNTALPGAYVNGTLAGGAFSASNPNGLAWFFSPSISPGASSTVTFQSDISPGMGNGQASDGAPPSPWSSVDPSGSQVPVPAVSEPPARTLLAASIPFLIFGFRAASRRRARLGL